MLHADLGQRAPLCDCPTRVNPEIKKAYSCRDSFNTPIKSTPKKHTYSAAQLAVELGVDKKTFQYHACKLIGKKTTNEMYNDEIIKVVEWFRTHKVRRPMKRSLT